MRTRSFVVNGVTSKRSAGRLKDDLVLMGLSCLFLSLYEWKRYRYGLARGIARPAHRSHTFRGNALERISEEKLVDELQQMTIVGNNIARSKERDVHYAVQLASAGSGRRARPCVLVASASSEVADLWNAGKMLRRLCKIRRSVEDPDPFSTRPIISWIGVGFCAAIVDLSDGHHRDLQHYFFQGKAAALYKFP